MSPIDHHAQLTSAKRCSSLLILEANVDNRSFSPLVTFTLVHVMKCAPPAPTFSPKDPPETIDHDNGKVTTPKYIKHLHTTPRARIRFETFGYNRVSFPSSLPLQRHTSKITNQLGKAYIMVAAFASARCIEDGEKASMEVRSYQA